MSLPLQNCMVAMIVTDGFEQSEMVEPRRALQELGAIVTLISPGQQHVRGWHHNEWGDMFSVNLHINDARAQDYHALVLPGGVMNPDALRTIPLVLEFIKSMAAEIKPIAAICHGPWTLINAGIVHGKNVTSWPSLRIDLENAGARWSDKEVVVDNNLITSRNPGDLPAFNRTLTDMLMRSHQE